MTASFLVDEDMPRSTAGALREAGYQAEDVRDVGLRGHTDQEVYACAQAHATTLISADLGFSNPWRFPSRAHSGIILVRLPNEMPTALVNGALINALGNLGNEDLAGTLIIVEPGRIRRRR
jgi:predicted nuclease of predicted toxin-antitoxin system